MVSANFKLGGPDIGMYDIATGNLLKGKRLPPKVERNLEQWLVMNKKVLTKYWFHSTTGMSSKKMFDTLLPLPDFKES